MKNYLVSFLALSFALVMFFYIPSSASQSKLDSDSDKPIYHIPLRVHLGKSQRPPKQWLPALEEINFIWFSQANICFDMYAVEHDEEMENGLDIWFESTIPGWNGYFTDQHDMHVRDDPDLRPATNPARSSAARTAAHELGHALTLPHRQDSDDNLMRSKTYGWQLNASEIMQARKAAKDLESSRLSTEPCGIPAIHTNP